MVLLHTHVTLACGAVVVVSQSVGHPLAPPLDTMRRGEVLLRAWLFVEKNISPVCPAKDGPREEAQTAQVEQRHLHRRVGAGRGDGDGRKVNSRVSLEEAARTAEKDARNLDLHSLVAGAGGLVPSLGFSGREGGRGGQTQMVTCGEGGEWLHGNDENESRGTEASKCWRQMRRYVQRYPVRVLGHACVGEMHECL